MQIKLTPPLTMKTVNKTKLELLPVYMPNGRPSSSGPNGWNAFINHSGMKLHIESADAQRVQDYMRAHDTEALSEDGEMAFTLFGNQLIECSPDAFGEEKMSSDD